MKHSLIRVARKVTRNIFYCRSIVSGNTIYTSSKDSGLRRKNIAKIIIVIGKEQLDVSDSVVSKHLKVLEDANYFRLIKKTEFTRQRTWVSLTPKGRRSFKLHLEELKRIIGET
ncbi:transcriptional regulator [Porticoccaceae bacterium nBUS_17]